ncbi:NAD(P)-dependent oxidoreductase [Pseudomonas sp. TH05]|uniref:NAD-dependent epimerase/dehydratase family protein n=1 Tax=unclassified Pseudomonas TaxID=196821 RepID=UPI00191437CA|nr:MULTISPECIES: NAD(P)-dependent oxidoreductase [unclassified Pseudomonas]MBK5539804.1 NAD(P)-dependent oxidoreductase [Pseudomonas sp. TH07]MBK5554655.1 NAD(P)-dependent oxidoreductase [Pseudomonas sp. TH05]
MKVTLDSPVVLRDLQRLSKHLDACRELAGKHLLITGSTGFFGKWLLALIAFLNSEGAGIEVTAVSRSPERFLDDYPQYRRCGWVTWLQGDVQALHNLPELRPVDMVIHAATDTLAGAHGDPLCIFDTILNGARNVLDLALATGAKRVLFTGTGAQYGVISPSQPVPETHTSSCNSLLASSGYAEAKRAQETLAALYADRHGLESILTRCFAFSGPGIPLNAHFAIGNFIRDAIGHEALVMQSTGQSVRSYLHGADLAVWLLTLLVRGQSGQAYNVGSDQGLSIAELAQRVVARVAPETPIIMPRAHDGEAAASYYVPDIQKARALGLDDWTTLDESIDSMVDWYLDRPLR